MIDWSELKKKKKIKKGVLVEEESLSYLNKKYPEIPFSILVNEIIKDFIKREKEKK